ncbi:MAG: ferrous iron transport protein B [Promethearchaeia archaeon]
MSCPAKKSKKREKLKNKGNYNNVINIALAGNPNVGKSVIFNQLTGMSQTIGNWPGKTVERMEGSLEFLGYEFNIVDLPGIYSLSTYTLEEIVSREYIISDEVDIIINVVDATNLERNLFLTFQLLELEVPVIIAINQMDLLRKRNMDLDFEKLEKIFKLPVLPLVAVHGAGVHQLLEEAIELAVFHHSHEHYSKEGNKIHEKLSHEEVMKIRDLNLPQGKSAKESFQFPDLSHILKFGKEVEKKVDTLIEEIKPLIRPKEKQPATIKTNYPPRFLAAKILQNDKEIKKIFKKNQKTRRILELTERYRQELEEFHGEDIHTIISSEIYTKINKIVEMVLIIKSEHDARKVTMADRLDHLTTHSFWGYIILILVIFGIYVFTFSVGDFFGVLLEDLYAQWTAEIYTMYSEENLWINILWNGGLGGFIGAVAGVLVYVVPFFLVIEILQDSGYLPRAAFLMDKFMHFIGVHGKTIIPMILGFGCNVPACAGCRIMETQREKKISIALTSLVPCAAVMTVVLGLVGRYLGMVWVIVLFVINFSVIIIVGKILNKTMPGRCTELIMEMHDYRVPNTEVILKQTWLRTKEFVYKALPIIVILGMFLEIMLEYRLLDPVNIILFPITVFWLGLPLITGVFLIYGILRKELTLVLLGVLANSLGTSLVELLTPVQMVTFSLVTMLYIPCFATIIVIAKQTNWKYALQISLLEIGLAILIGGIVRFAFIPFL